MKFLCEPNLGKRGLYPLTSELNGIHPAELRTNVLCCGGKPVEKISHKNLSSNNRQGLKTLIIY